MRRIIVLSFITLDGVMQAPGGPEKDKSGGFGYGGWTARLFDDGTIPSAFKLKESSVTPNGVIIANYERAGEIKTGTVGES